MNPQPTLRDVYLSHQGKGSDKWSSYLDAYDSLLCERRNDVESILEIGVQNGGSLEIWSKYFSNIKHVVGMDIDPKVSWLEYADPRIRALVGDASTLDVAASLKKTYPEGFDIIIDDGSHQSGDIVRSFAVLFDQVKVGGIYAAEDLHCSYWEDWKGGLHDPHSSVSFFKFLVDIVNFEHWGIQSPRSELLKGFAQHYGIEFQEDQLAQIAHVEFVNSICFIHKSDPCKTKMEPRIFTGEQQAVARVSHLGGEIYAPPSQSTNPWSVEGSSFDEKLKEIEVLKNEKLQLQVDFTDQLRACEARMDDLKEGHARQLARVRESEQQIFLQLHSARQDFAERLRSHEMQLGSSQNHSDSLREELTLLRKELDEYVKSYIALRNSLSWKLMAPVRFVASPIFGTTRFIGKVTRLLSTYTIGEAAKMSGTVLKEQGVGGLITAIQQSSNTSAHSGEVQALHDTRSQDANNYLKWLDRNDPLTPEVLGQLAKQVKDLPRQPLISVVMPVYNPPMQYLHAAIASLQSQVYSNWELCIADDASPNAAVRDYLQALTQRDSRIKVIYRERNGHISAATNSALELASGEFIALMDNDDEIPPHALAYVALKIAERPDAEIIYSDEDKMTTEGVRYDPYFKSDFNYELFLAQNMISHFGVYRRSTVMDIGGFRVGMEGAQDWDLALRVLEKVGAGKIEHIPRVLYHWRAIAGSTAVDVGEKSYASSAQLKVIQGHLERVGKNAEVFPAPGAGGMTRVKHRFSPQKISIVIPTRDRIDLLRQCILSIREKSTFTDFEIIIANNESAELETLAYFEVLRSEGVKIVDIPGEFNYSRINNIAVSYAEGELICLMNNDIEIISPDWMEEMGSFAQQDDIGCVGAKLWYPNNTLQHGGVILGIAGAAGHAFKGVGRDNFGYFGRAILHQSYSAVTAACLMVRKSIYKELSGLDELLAIAYNDVDFCLRVKSAGYRNVWTPYAQMYHHESASRGDDLSSVKSNRLSHERDILISRWKDVIEADPAYSINLTLDREDFSFAHKARNANDR